ncbi:collagen alpha-1(XV) chain-like [Homalodisca vitripennis]|nr:collagen alpha-1(XV) chain-like [Homalodisca vitripennis]
MSFLRRAVLAVCIAFVCLQESSLAARIQDVDMTEKDLLQAIKIPFDDPNTVFFDYGLEGFPAMGLKPGSDIKSPYRLYLPERFYAEFSITATVKLASKEGGFLFAVVNPLDTVVELGVHLGGAGAGMSNLSLLYTDVATHYSSQSVASFLLPSSFSRWGRFALKVTAEEVTVYFNCEKYDTIPVKREPQELVFDSASTLYVGQAGPYHQGGARREYPLM